MSVEVSNESVPRTAKLIPSAPEPPPMRKSKEAWKPENAGDGRVKIKEPIWLLSAGVSCPTPDTTAAEPFN